MSTRSLRRSVTVALVVSLCLALADSAIGQSPGATSSQSQAAPAASVPASASAAPSVDISALRVGVHAVNESRDSLGRGTIHLDLSIVGGGLPLGAILKQITVLKAVDNLGNELRSSSAGASAPGGAVMLTPFAIGPYAGQAFLEASVRKAESLQSVEGIVVLFLPSEANGSLIRIPNVVSHAGQIEDPALAKQGIEFHFFPDQASYDEAKKQIADFVEVRSPPDLPLNRVGYFFRDPRGRLASHQLHEANGSVIRRNGGSISKEVNRQSGTIRLQAPLPPDAQLVFHLAIPESMKMVPFRVENIALP